MANMYFVLFGYSEFPVAPSTIQRLMTAIDSVTQAQLLMRDLRLRNVSLLFFVPTKLI